MPPARKPRWERRPRRSPVLMPSVVSRGGDGSPSRVLINAGDGTFPMSITLPGGSAITGWIAAVDLDGDGDLDVLADGGSPLFGRSSRRRRTRRRRVHLTRTRASS
jgi:hypothetical protein